MENIGTNQNLLASKHRWIYVAIAFGSFVCLLLAHFVFIEKASFWHVMFKELGTAILIAMILVFTVERFTRERHEKAADDMMMNINKNLFNAIFKRYIPERVFEQVEKCVMESKVYRHEHELDYVIEKFGAKYSDDLQKNFFKCTAHTRYQIENLLDQQITHNVFIRLERPLFEEHQKICEIVEISIDKHHLSPEEIKKHTKYTDQHIEFCYPCSLAQRSSLQVKTKSILVKQQCDMEIWCSQLPSDGFKLEVSTPSKDITVHAVANHHEKLEEQTVSEVSHKWVLDYGVFPHQSIILWWKPVKINATGQQ
jgi:hypothetical protein